MAFLVETALSNMLVASCLAVLAAIVGLWGRRPAATHALWLLVMVKLITPPLFECSIPWPETTTPAPPEPVAQVKLPVEVELPNRGVDAANVEMPDVPPADEWPQEPNAVEAPVDIAPVELPPLPVAAAVPPVPDPPVVAAADSWTWWNVVAILWLTGTGFWLSLALRRLWRFQRLLRFASAAPSHVQGQAQELADCLGVRCPEIGMIPGSVSPMLWTLGRAPRLLLPAGLLERLSPEQLATLLAHELAHWRRRDDRVRWIEFIVLALYWWCPLAWWARRELHQAEEECCDAWVVSLLPESAKEYALALVETVEFMSAAPASLPPLASGLGRVRLLKRRLKMILKGKTPRALTFTGLAVVAGVGLLMLPLVFSRTADNQIAAQGKPPAAQPGGDPMRPAQVQEIRAELQRLQAEIEKFRRDADKRQQEMQKHAEELQRALQRLQQAGGGAGGPPPMGGGGGGPRDPMGGGGGFGKVPMGGKGGGGGGGPMVPGGGGGFPGGPGGGPGLPGGPGGGFGGKPIEQRIADVERKLDTLLQELRALRSEIRPGMKGPGATPRPMGPGAGPGGLPAPIRDPNLPPAGVPGGNAPPMPPMPGAPPTPPRVTPPPVPMAPPGAPRPAELPPEDETRP